MQNSRFIPPAGYRRIKTVGSFEELVTAGFGPDVNAICWPRALAGDFDELAECFSGEDEVLSLDDEMIDALRPRLSAAGLLAADALLEDQRLLRAHGLSPNLECVSRYQRDEKYPCVPTDVYSFHADRAPVATDTYLCSYNQSATEGLRNDMAQKRTDIPALRAELTRIFHAGETGDFEDWLQEHCHDLHYTPHDGAAPFSFGIGNLWRIAVEYPGCPVSPCLHRAPESIAGRPPRLLLIS